MMSKTNDKMTDATERGLKNENEKKKSEYCGTLPKKITVAFRDRCESSNQRSQPQISNPATAAGSISMPSTMAAAHALLVLAFPLLAWSAVPTDLVTQLPGFDPPPFKMYSGYA